MVLWWVYPRSTPLVETTDIITPSDSEFVAALTPAFPSLLPGMCFQQNSGEGRQVLGQWSKRQDHCLFIYTSILAKIYFVFLDYSLCDSAPRHLQVHPFIIWTHIDLCVSFRDKHHRSSFNGRYGFQTEKTKTSYVVGQSRIGSWSIHWQTCKFVKPYAFCCWIPLSIGPVICANLLGTLSFLGD